MENRPLSRLIARRPLLPLSSRPRKGVRVIPDEMTYIAMKGAGGPEVLALAKGPVPRPGAGEALIRVAAAGVNRPDIAQRNGRYAPPAGASPILGLEISGRVVSLGERTRGLKSGDEVIALLSGGGYAEFCLAPAAQCLPLPRRLSLIEAAALPEALFTAWTNLFERGRLKAGERVLIHGGSSGVGTIAIQLARAFGARVFTTAGSEEKCEACVKLGAEAAINYKTSDFVEKVRELTAGKGVDVILDMVGGDYLRRNVESLAVDGRLLQIAFQKDSEVVFNFLPLLTKRLSLSGSTLRSRSVAEKGEIGRALKQKVWPLIEAGRVKPVVFKVFPLAEAAQAHRLMEAGGHIGKIVLAVAAESDPSARPQEPRLGA
jgi:putative PIG3 family NAD(P)H quinone oxidoreductase